MYKQISEIKSNYDEDTDFDIKSYQEELQNIKNYYKSQIKLENEKDEVNTILLNEDFSYKVLEKNINTLKVKIQNLENKCGENNEELSEEELRIIIKDQENYKETKIRINKDLKNINSEIDEYKIKLDDIKNKHIEKYEKIMDIEEIKDIIKKEESNIDEYNIKKEKCNENIEQIELYKKYIEDNDRYQKLKTKVIDLEKKEKEDKNKYTAAVSFSKNILEAESIAMTNIIESINNYAQIYLEQFFNDNPIIVKLLSFKETKKNNKPQINLEIDYKGMECDLTSLSGGEVSRVVLAFTLALSEMFNSPLILLDECTASLDQDLTTTVFDAIKENFKTKTVIVVAHQVIEGVFDKIIKL
jgi:DNA repair exonuclease SbcCD ATPase subunit